VAYPLIQAGKNCGGNRGRVFVIWLLFARQLLIKLLGVTRGVDQLLLDFLPSPYPASSLAAIRDENHTS